MGDGIIRIRRTFDEIELTAEDVVEAIQDLSNEEKWKLLDSLYDEYYNLTDKKGSQRIIEVKTTFITSKVIRSSKISTATFYDN
ncbi:hypothetical protein AAHB54_23825 [Bacillus cereus]